MLGEMWHIHCTYLSVNYHFALCCRINLGISFDRHFFLFGTVDCIKLKWRTLLRTTDSRTNNRSESGITCCFTRLDQLWIGIGPGNAGFLINFWVLGLIWQAWISSSIWCMPACSPTKSDWMIDKNVQAIWPWQAPLRKPKKYKKFKVVLSVLNQMNLWKFCVSY